MEPFFAFLGWMELIILLLVLVVPLTVIGGIVALVIHQNKKNKAQPDESGAGKLPPPLTTATCMWCLEEVKAGAKVCKHCGKNPSE